jgi:hypothetical protein
MSGPAMPSEKNVISTKARRITAAGTPNCCARPPQTPAIMRSCDERYQSPGA